MKKYLIGILVALMLALAPATGALAATTADVTVTITLANIEISDNVTTWAAGTQALSAEPYTNEDYVGVTNSSTVTIDVTIYVVNNTWTGGANPWTHNDAATAGADTIGAAANAGGTWGVSDVNIPKSASPALLKDNLGGPGDDFTYGIKLYCPTSDTDHAQKTNDVRISAAAS